MAIIKASEASHAVPLDLRDVEAEASARLAQARREAEGILEAARAEAAAIRRTADRERGEAAARGKAEGREDGRAEGRAEGREAAVQEARARLAPSADAVGSALAALRSAADSAARSASAGAEAAVIRLALDIARLVVRREVALDESIVLRSVARAVELAPRRSGLEIRVHSRDREALERFLPDLTARFEGLGVTAIETDDSVGRGGCRLRLGDGQVDAAIATQLAEIERALLGEGA